ncbi:MAG: tetratricopeptide repeat protein [Chitinophagaceae bacterium]|nr:tetratricopeptide repeat protein [Chitinophagaceae bacterium]
MFRLILINVILLIAAISFPFTSSKNSTIEEITALKLKSAMACTPDRTSIAKIIAEGEEITLLPGSGNYVWKINTGSDSAQLYFNQGMNMYYGFHIIEAIASLKKAVAFDESNPMIHWAEALAYGPNINDVVYAAAPDALAATQRAMELSSSANDVEKALIQAMSVRYSADTTISRETLNQAYVDAMKAVAEKFPGNADVLALYADAMMLQHPWDLWTYDGVPKPWQPAIQEVLERVIKLNDMHPGGNHYYIHTVEASGTPEKAMHSADVLGKITPGLSHMVHMPSHIYLRTGHFDRGIAINAEAVATYREYMKRFPPSGGNAFIYYWHNLHMLVNCAMLAGRYNEALTSADELAQALDEQTLSEPAPVGSFLGYMYVTPLLVNTRFSKWDAILAAKQPASKFTYANVLYHFAKGMAYAGTSKLDEANNEVMQMEELMKDENLKIPMSPFSAVIEGSNVALETLRGSIALKKNDVKQAITHFENAAKREWQMVYTEPRDWTLNPYHYLGNAYLADKNYKKAEEAFRQDLSGNARNVWALAGLEKALRMQGKKKEAGQVKNELKEASKKSDISLK